MARVKSRRPAVAATPMERPPLNLTRGRRQIGPPPSDGDAYPTTSNADYRALLAAQLERDRHLSDLPDIYPEDFEDPNDYAQWIAEGGQRFSTYEKNRPDRSVRCSGLYRRDGYGHLVPMNRTEARKIVSVFMRRYQPPITCAHRFTRWYGLLIQWRSCEHCRLVEGRIG